VTYYIPLEGNYKPYVGLIYRHIFIDKPYRDYDAYGGRVGIAIVTAYSDPQKDCTVYNT